VKVSKNQCWDIFCQVVDNYGDIGICWRLSQQLASEHKIKVRLFINDMVAAQHIIANLALNQASQIINGVNLCVWPEISVTPAQVVIAAFDCKLPDSYSQKLFINHSTWINLEYLSAEPWVGDFHAKSSPQPALGLTKHFFFPGFTPNTGGLVREHNLIANRDAFLKSSGKKAIFWARLGLSHLAKENMVRISLFSYPEAQIRRLFSALANHKNIIHIVMPFNGNLSQYNAAFSDCTQSESQGSCRLLQQGNLSVHLVPFLSQDDYDHLLWACDLNFVRGEDSWIRAIWAGKPFIWQPYWQADKVHIQKMLAFLHVYNESASRQMQTLLLDAHQEWSANDTDLAPAKNLNQALWTNLINQLPALAAFTYQRSNTLTLQTDLATKLVIFSENLRNNQV